jgi:hypothetical protein
MRGKALPALGTALLTVVLIVAAAAFFVSRDDATVPQSQSSGPGVARPAGASPKVGAGNVVLLYSDERETRALRLLAERIAGAPDPALEAAGQAVLVERRPNLSAAVTAVTATRMLEASSPDDPALESFVEYWLGREP